MRERADLPRFDRYSIPPREGSIECKFCPARIMPAGARDHMRAKHPEKWEEFLAMRQFVSVEFKEGGRPYAYHYDGEPLAIGDRARVPLGHGEKTVKVIEIWDRPPPFETKAILGLAPADELELKGENDHAE